jgi:imidazolonepropionase-like amidohydrolase
LARLVLDNVRVYTAVEGSKPIGRGVVVIEDGVIRDVGTRGEVEIPSDARVIDCKGYTALPGLIDAHLHVTGLRTADIVKEPLITPLGVLFARAVRDLEALLKAGYTTVVDAGGIVGLHLKYAVEEGSIDGPRIVAAGYPLSQTFGHADIHYLPVEYVDARTTRKPTVFAPLICDGPDECRKAVRYALREGADFIKVMASGGVLSEKDRPEYRQFTIEELRAIVDEARAAGRIVHAHAQGSEGIRNAIEAGVRVIAHAIHMDEELALLARDRGVVVVPTIAVLRKILELGPESGLPEWGLRKAEEVSEAHVENVRRAWRLGVKIAAGSDFFGGPFRLGENIVELKYLVELIGMQPREAIDAATRVAAEAAGLAEKVGTLEPGKRADVVVVRGDPLTNIEPILDPSNIVLVVREGRVFKNLLEAE